MRGTVMVMENQHRSGLKGKALNLRLDATMTSGECPIYRSHSGLPCRAPSTSISGKTIV